MAHDRPKMRLTREEWHRIPPEKRLEAGDRCFTYLTQLAARDGEALILEETRVLYEVQFVAEPVPGMGLFEVEPREYVCAACEREVRLHRTLMADDEPCPHCAGRMHATDASAPVREIPRHRPRLDH